MKNLAIVGLGFGDEGKGTITDYLCSQCSNPLVIRYSGGHQAGHTVYYNNKHHIFSNFGSGTLRGVPTFWSKYCTVDPIGIMNELSVLMSIGIFQPKLFIDPDSPITTPYDKFYNHNTETSNHHGSCGVGYGATIEREEKHYSLTFSDLFYSDIFKIKLKMIEKYYYNIFDKNYTQYPYLDNSILDQMIKDFNIYCDQLKQLSFIEQKSLCEVIYSDYIFEGAQGILLDQNMGFFPHVSRSNSGTKNIIELIGKTNQKDIHYYLVTRAYQTRHGNGPMTNDKRGHSIIENPDETNINRKWQGKFRRSLLDLDLIQYAINKDEGLRNSKNKTLVVTCLDHMKNDYRFTHKGEIVASTSEEEFIKVISNILGIYILFINDSPDSKTFKKIFL